jgi:hypothetical protein
MFGVGDERARSFLRCDNSEGSKTQREQRRNDSDDDAHPTLRNNSTGTSRP